MKLSQFQFILPKDRIAQEPPRWRDECRLMVLHKKTGEIEHRVFKDIIDYFGKGDTFVFNDTKVMPARLYGKKEKTGADIMVFLLRELNKEQRLWDVIVDPARRGQGVGRTMLRLALRYAFDIYQADRVSLAVFENNAPACACYRAAGFAETGLRETYRMNGAERTALEMACARASGAPGKGCEGADAHA